MLGEAEMKAWAATAVQSMFSDQPSWTGSPGARHVPCPAPEPDEPETEPYLGFFPPSRTMAELAQDNNVTWENRIDSGDLLAKFKQERGWASFVLRPFDRFREDLITVLHRFETRGEDIKERPGVRMTIQISHARLEDPLVLESDGTWAPQRPFDACGRKETYAAPLRANITVLLRRKKDDGTLQSPPIQCLVLRNVLLARVPVMAGSSGCMERLWPSGHPLASLDWGGYFVVTGTEKSITARITMRNDRLVVSRPRKSNKRFALVTEFRPKELGRWRSTSTMHVVLLSDTHMLAVHMPFNILFDLPMFAAFRMLGVETRREAARCITAAGMVDGSRSLTGTPLDDPALESWVYSVLCAETGFTGYRPGKGVKKAPHIPDFESMTADDTMDWFATVCPSINNRQRPYVPPQRELRLYNVRNILCSELFPHVGTRSFSATRHAKISMLAYAAWRTVSVAWGRISQDDHADFANLKVFFLVVYVFF